MTAREYLAQARRVERELAALRERQAYYFDLATRSTARYNALPGGGRRSTGSVEEYVGRIVDLETEIAGRVEAYAELVLEIERAIDAVPDPACRELLRYRYLNGWSLRRIAQVMGYSYDYVRHLHRDALQLVDVPDKVGTP